MKKYVTAALFIFWVIVTGLFVAGLLFYQKNANQGASDPGKIAVKSVTTNLSAAELTKHKSASDCWLLVSGKIYNVSAYLDSHPAGAAIIIPTCGTDATAAFSTKGGAGNNHSSFAWSLLGKYYIGDLGQAVSQTKLQAAPATDPAIPNAADDNEGEYEREDD